MVSWWSGGVGGCRWIWEGCTQRSQREREWGVVVVVQQRCGDVSVVDF
jgi:hypothetical protein